MADNYYIHIEGWMITELQLNGNDLVIFAIVYNFTNGKIGQCQASYQTISEMAGISKRTTFNVLQKLEEKGYIKRGQSIKYKDNFINTYIIAEGIENFAIGYGKNCNRGIEEIATPYGKNCNRGIENFATYNNIDNNIDNNNDNNIIESDSRKNFTYTFIEIWQAYNKGNPAQGKIEWEKLTAQEKHDAVEHMKVYLMEGEPKYRKNIENYLREKYWNVKQIKKGGPNGKVKPSYEFDESDAELADIAVAKFREVHNL